MCIGEMYLEPEGQIGPVKPGNNITRGCAKEARIKGKEWSVPFSHTRDKKCILNICILKVMLLDYSLCSPEEHNFFVIIQLLLDFEMDLPKTINLYGLYYRLSKI